MSLSETEIQRRRAFGRGIYHGLIAAGISDPEKFMNTTRLARIENGLNSLAKKVLDAVPATETWTKEQIASELYREGHRVALNVMVGALSRMCDQGLVREPERGRFIRVQGQDAETIDQQEITIVSSTIQPIRPEAPPPPPPPAPPPPRDTPPRDVLTRLAQIAVMLRSLANETEAIALETEERMQELKRDTEKLRQLQQLLKSIGTTESHDA